MSIVENEFRIIGTVEKVTQKQLTKSTIYETIMLTNRNGKPCRVPVTSFRTPPPHGTECQAVGQLDGREWQDKLFLSAQVEYFSVPYHSSPQPQPQSQHSEAKANAYQPEPPPWPEKKQPELPKARDEDMPF